MTRFDTMQARRAADRRTRGLEAARRIASALAPLGCRTFVFGSMVRGSSGPAADLDLAVDCPETQRYRIEARAQEIAGDIPVDIVYLDELRGPWLSRIREEMVDAAGLR